MIVVLEAVNPPIKYTAMLSQHKTYLQLSAF